MDNSFEEFIYFNKKKILIIISLIILFLGLGAYYCYNKYFKEDKKENDSKSLVLEKVDAEENITDIEEDKSETKDETDTTKENNCFFDIKGEVKKPNVYSIACDKRVIDAITLAGGLTKNSDTSILNLSKKIEDGMVIIVYSKKEVNNYLKTLETEEKKQTICENGNIVNGACISNKDNSSQSKNTNSANEQTLININTATLDQLMTLSGIGESKAKEIISYREKTPFKKIDDIMNVEGIGESIYSKIKKNITV